MCETSDTRSANLKWIRTRVFDLQQEEFATLLGLSRTRLSKYENGYHPVPIEVMDRVRLLAKERDLAFEAEWFFAVPSDEAAA